MSSPRRKWPACVFVLPLQQMAKTDCLPGLFSNSGLVAYGVDFQLRLITIKNLTIWSKNTIFAASGPVNTKAESANWIFDSILPPENQLKARQSDEQRSARANPMTPRARRTKSRTRIQEVNERRILSAALDIFASQGFKGSTIDQIAEKAEMSKPNLLYYFRRKQDIYRTLLEHTLTDWLAPLEPLSADGDPIEQISAYIRLKMELSRANPKASRLFANEMLHGAHMIGDVLSTSLKSLVDEKAGVIDGWIDQGRLAPVDPYHLIFMIWAATQTYADFEVQTRAIMGKKVNTPQFWQDATETALRIFVEGLRPREE